MIGSPLTRQRWLVGVLVASLAVNAFVIGATATDFVHVRWPFGHRGGGGASSQLRFELAWLRGRLPPDAMAKVEVAVEATKPGTMQSIDRLRGLRRELGALIAEPQPDRAAIDAKLGEIRAEVTAMQAEVQRVATDTLVVFPPDVRATLAEDRHGAGK
ncbi:MAG: periplasmic heavy metal sensor [Bauldia sp.]